MPKHVPSMQAKDLTIRGRCNSERKADINVAENPLRLIAIHNREADRAYTRVIPNGQSIAGEIPCPSVIIL